MSDEHDHQGADVGGACCAECAADPVLSVQGCAPCAAALVAGMTDDEVAGHLAAAGVGFGNTDDVGSTRGRARPGGADLGQGFAKFGETLSNVIDAAEPLLRSNPYTSVIADVNDAAQAATQGPQAPPPPPAPPASQAAAASRFAGLKPNPAFMRFARSAQFGLRTDAARRALATSLTPDAMQTALIERLKLNIRQAAAGVAVSQQYFRDMKARADAGDPESRRQWAAALALAPELRGRR